MPPPAQRDQRYVAGLDGIRALAVLAVIAYHLDIRWAQGGMLGVGVFFTLSGYLITDLLLAHWVDHGDLGLGQFWLRRARRLLPALFLMLAVVSVWVAWLDAAQLATMRQQVFAAVGYFSNWWTIAQHGSYFARFATPLPLDHLWSLAIEEQFYLLWPWMLLLGIRLVPNRGRLALVTLGLALASGLLMGVLYHHGSDPTRVYEGTDTRALGLLVGAALAMVWPTRSAIRPTKERGRRLLDGIGLAGLGVILLLVWQTESFSSFLYPWGFALLAVATAMVVGAVVVPGSRLGAALGARPLRWVGVRSYAIYLWHWPIIILTRPTSGHVGVVRGTLEVAATFGVSALSWRYVEDPIRHGALGRLWRRARSGAGRVATRRQALAASGLAMGVLALPVLGLSGGLPAASAGHLAAGSNLTRVPTPSGASRRAAAEQARTRPSGPPRTSCKSAVYLGDSTSEGEVSTEYIPDAKKRLPAQLARVGVRTTFPEVSGARSIVETFEGQPNAATVAQQHVSEGFRGCWIVAMGTNDVDNVHDGSTFLYPERIRRMMAIIGRHPALWVNVISLRPAPDPYSGEAMTRWNSALMAACRRYPTLRVFDWAAHARRPWFIPDGIHYTSKGYEERSRLIADGLAHAFPAQAPPSRSCLVS